MDRIYLLLILSLSLGCAPATTTTVSIQTPPETPKADHHEADVALTTAPSTPSDRTATDSVILIDVRTKEEWDTGHAATALHIPHDEISDRITEVTSDKDAEIVLYCKSGGRAGRAKSALEELGFTNVENAGGYEDIQERLSE